MASRVGAGAVWMSGGDACVAQAHPGPFPVNTRFLVEPTNTLTHTPAMISMNIVIKELQAHESIPRASSKDQFGKAIDS
jgi:hypothetical protein